MGRGRGNELRVRGGLVPNFLRLGIRNLTLYRRRSLLTGLVMVFSVGTIIFAAALGEAFYHQLVDVGIKTTTGHLQIFPEGWDFDIVSPMSGDIPRIRSSSKIQEIISRSPFFKVQGREILYQCLLYDSTDRHYYGTIVGVEMEKLRGTSPGLQLVKGSDISKDDPESLFISRSMEEYFRPGLKDRMYIITGGPGGMMEGVKLSYAGTIQSMPVFADHVAYTPISKVQRLLGWDEDDCSNIKVILRGQDKADLSAAWLKERFQEAKLDLQVRTWRELGGFYYHIALLGRVLVFFLLLVLAGVTATSVSTTMLMSIKERTREIGTLMAMGFKRRHILFLFLAESFSLSLLSALGGALLGSLVTFWFQNRGIVEGIALVLEGRLYPVLGFFPVVLSFLWILLVGTGSGLYPAYKASVVPPIEALRHT